MATDENPNDDTSAQPVPPPPPTIEEIESLTRRVMRWQADFENLQRRSAKEISDARAQATADVINEMLLPTMDALDIAVSLAGKTDLDIVIQGVIITTERLKKFLAGRGIVPFDPKGDPFDPAKHEAVMQEVSETVPPMTVLETFERGYTLGDKIVRFAKVKVSGK